ncbi:twitching motility protein PilT [Thioploca ingrica]|uniref:Twitching motility protein PilT n=1 Tax=Thioploca ingrica TaxID=40754 RepID=A0A090BV54_9GAMM|nr:twitching motility protein PilT [Thioploca ingrica]
MSVKLFVDTNIWIYAHLEGEDDTKHQKANILVEKTMQPLVISTQVLHEYYSAMLKNKMTDEWIQTNIEAMIEYCEIQLITLSIIRLTHRIKVGYQFSYSDSLIIASALDAGCNILYSEDLQIQQPIENQLQILNPFC